MSLSTRTFDGGGGARHKLLVLTHGSQAEVWSLDLVVDEYGPGPLAPGDVEHGLLMIQDVGGDVLDAAFSPDGSASGDGQVKFFQVYLHAEGPPRCISANVISSYVLKQFS